MVIEKIITIYWRRIPLLILFYQSLIFASCSPDINHISNGFLDIKNIPANKYILLDGDWNFYWNQYIKFDSVGCLNLKNKATIEVPKKWNILHDSLNFKAYGKGVYHLHVKNNQAQKLELKFQMLITSAYRVFIDTLNIYTSGNTGFNGNYKPNISSNVISFYVPPRDFNIYIEVGNYTHRKGGIYSEIYLGKGTVLSEKRNLKLLFEVIAITLLLCISLYSFLIYSIDRKQITFLLFGILLICGMLRQLTISEMPIALILPKLPYVIIDYMRFIGIYAGFGIAAKFLSLYFSELHENRLLKFAQWVSITAIFVTVFSPHWVNSIVIQFYNVFAGIILTFAAWFGIKHIKEHPIYKILTIGALIFLIVFFHDALAGNQLIKFGYIQQYGFLACILFQAYYLISSYNSLNEKFIRLTGFLTEYGVIFQKNESKLKEFEQQLSQIQMEIMDSASRQKITNLYKNIRQNAGFSDKEKLAIDTLLELNIDFVDNLKDKYPQLTSGEIELCLMIRANYTSKEIADARNINPSSVKMARNRLRKKLNIEGNIDLYQFISSI